MALYCVLWNEWHCTVCCGMALYCVLWNGIVLCAVERMALCCVLWNGTVLCTQLCSPHLLLVLVLKALQGVFVFLCRVSRAMTRGTIRVRVRVSYDKRNE